MTFDPNRRTVLKFSVGACAAILVRPGMASAPNAPGASVPALAELDYSQVKLTGPLDDQGREALRVLMGMDENALLRPFRVREGLPAPGEELPGWYGTYAFAPGANFGQWVSGLARYYAITRDEDTRAKLGRLVKGYADTVGPEGKFYRDNRFPSYTYDKLVGAMVDARRLANDGHALAALKRSNQAALPYLPTRAVPRNEHALAGEDFSQHAWDESYTIPENQFLAWRLTGDPLHRRLGQRFLYDDFFGPLARGHNVLPGKHAYSHVNALSSAAQAYATLGDARYLAAARHGFDFVDAQSFATGGWGPDEHFVQPGTGALATSLVKEHKSFETPCGSYAHFKLTRYLLRTTGDARYGDSMERVMYNTILGAKHIQADGHAFYYSDYSRQAEKTFHPDHWPCCSATLPIVAADYRISTYFRDAQGLYVNLYVPGEVTWRQGGNDARLAVDTGYPYSSAIAITVGMATPQTFALRLRIPAWAEGASLRVNGKLVPATPGSFAQVRRQWRDGDRIELELPLAMRLQAIEDGHDESVALLAGPLVLMRLVDDGDLATTRRDLLMAKQSDRGQWRLPDGGRMLAFPDITDQRYRTYQDVSG